MEISALGDLAFLIGFSDESSERERLLNRVLSGAAAIQSAQLAGVVEVTTSYTTIAVFIDSTVDLPALQEQIATLLANAPNKSYRRSSTVEVPVCYAPEFGLDLDRIAAQVKMSPDSVVELHSKSSYTVACIGFMPGFPYLTGLPVGLRTARLEEPRVRVPVGSVAIANDQTGIYPLESPGGWNIIGRTPLRLFDISKTEPSLLRAGDKVRFVPINRAEFESYARE